MIPNLTRLIFSSVRTSVAWTIEKFVSLCEALVRAAVQSAVLVVVAVLLLYGSSWLQSRALMIAGVVVGLIGFMYLAIASSIFRIGIEALASISVLIKREVERLSNIMFGGVLAVFYLSLDRAYEYPALLFAFLGILVVLYWATILPDSSLTLFFKKRFQWLILLSAISLTIVAVVPKAVTARVSNSHWLEKITGTVANEIPFLIDEQDQIIDLTTNQPMELFERVSPKGEQPKALKGWTRDKKGNHHLYYWFDGQTNSTPMGQAIEPVTREKLDEIVAQTKRVAEEKLAADKKAVADAEAARLKAEEEYRQETQRAVDEINRQQTEAMEEERRQLALQPIEVPSTILAATNQSQDIMVTRPTTPFTYQGQVVQPEQSVVVLGIIDVKTIPTDKNKYELVLQPQMLMVGEQKYDISRQTATIQFIVKKDNSRSIWKILGGAAAGAVAGGLVGGKEGATAGLFIGVTAGTIYAVTSHGKKFQLVVGDPVPPIIITPVL